MCLQFIRNYFVVDLNYIINIYRTRNRRRMHGKVNDGVSHGGACVRVIKIGAFRLYDTRRQDIMATIQENVFPLFMCPRRRNVSTFCVRCI